MTPWRNEAPAITRYEAAAQLCVDFAMQLNEPLDQTRQFLEGCYVAVLPRA
jgi:hypothetical protein